MGPKNRARPARRHAAGVDRATLREIYRRRHAKKRAAQLLARYEALVARDGPTCDLCGAGAPVEFDHIIPKPAGGTDDLENLCLAHEYCNKAKGVSEHAQARQRLTSERMQVEAAGGRWPPEPWETRRKPRRSQHPT